MTNLDERFKIDVLSDSQQEEEMMLRIKKPLECEEFQVPEYLTNKPLKDSLDASDFHLREDVSPHNKFSINTNQYQTVSS